MTIIEFKPTAWDGSTPKAAGQKDISYTSAPYQEDSFEFSDYELPEQQPKSFMNGIFGPKRSKRASVSPEILYDKAQCVQCEALSKRNEISRILFKCAGKNYTDITNADGSYIEFEEDQLGRGVMKEYLPNGKLTRETTFIFESGEIYRIKEMIPGSKKYNKIAFFNFDDSHFEVLKGVSEGLFKETTDEIYTFEQNEPTYYRAGRYYDYRGNSGYAFEYDFKK